MVPQTRLHDVYARRAAASTASRRGERAPDQPRSGPPAFITEAYADSVFARRKREAAKASEGGVS